MFDVKSHLTFDMISDTTSSSTAYHINKDMSNILEVKGTQKCKIKVALEGMPKNTPTGTSKGIPNGTPKGTPKHTPNSYL